MGNAMKHFHPSIIQLFTLFKLLGMRGSFFNKFERNQRQEISGILEGKLYNGLVKLHGDNRIGQGVSTSKINVL